MTEKKKKSYINKRASWNRKPHGNSEYIPGYPWNNEDLDEILGVESRRWNNS